MKYFGLFVKIVTVFDLCCLAVYFGGDIVSSLTGRLKKKKPPTDVFEFYEDSGDTPLSVDSIRMAFQSEIPDLVQEKILPQAKETLDALTEPEKTAVSLLLRAYIGYINQEGPLDEQNFPLLMELLKYTEATPEGTLDIPGMMLTEAAEKSCQKEDYFSDYRRYKSRKLVGKSEDEWIRVEGTHEAIIPRELWDTVTSIGKKKVRKSTPSDGCKSIFTGLVYCADCGFKMRNHIEKFTYKDGRPGRYSSFICGNYSRSGRGACTIHTIYETVLTQLVLEDIREKARFAEYDPDRLMGEILRLKEKESHTRLFSYEQELKSSLARISDLERLMQNLYEDKCTGSIPQTVFQTLMQKYEAERAEKAEAVPELERKVRAHLENQVDTDRWLEIIRRYTEISELDETILFELVDRIEVGDTQIINGQRICEVKVYYRYVGNVDAALAQERGQDYGKAI